VTYTLRILPRAEKELSALDSKPYESVKKKIYGLRDVPRPPGCRKLADSPGWRIRVGDYRVVYEIDDAARTVTVLRVGHRKEIYR
jgi:mRNA interferase RelE/StbE